MKIRTRFLVASLLLAGSLLFAAPLEIARGNLKLILYPDTGSFCLYQLSDIGKNRYEPLFEDRNSAATSWFSVLSNGRVFRLSSRIGHPVVLEPTDTGARFIFTLTDDFQVEQAFSFVESSDKTLPVELKIETRIENTSGKDGVFALKALVDTTLGESEGIHFVTNMRNRISAETRFERNVDPDSVIVSKNKAQSLMFLLSGDDVSPPECLYVQNWDRLNTRTWKPDFLEGRSFNTLYAINDSALLFVWPEKTLVTGKKMVVTMVLGPYAPALVPAPKIGALTESISVDASIAEKNAMIERILARIAEVEKNPSGASDDELRQLNVTLDTLLKQVQGK